MIRVQTVRAKILKWSWRACRDAKFHEHSNPWRSTSRFERYCLRRRRAGLTMTKSAKNLSGKEKADSEQMAAAIGATWPELGCWQARYSDGKQNWIRKHSEWQSSIRVITFWVIIFCRYHKFKVILRFLVNMIKRMCSKKEHTSLTGSSINIVMVLGGGVNDFLTTVQRP